jgi:hypothetical protein
MTSGQHITRHLPSAFPVSQTAHDQCLLGARTFQTQGGLDPCPPVSPTALYTFARTFMQPSPPLYVLTRGFRHSIRSHLVSSGLFGPIGSTTLQNVLKLPQDQDAPSVSAALDRIKIRLISLSVLSFESCLTVFEVFNTDNLTDNMGLFVTKCHCS